MAELDNLQNNQTNNQTNNQQWQQQTIEKLALSGLKEQQTARRWSTFFKGLTFAYLFLLLILGLGDRKSVV